MRSFVSLVLAFGLVVAACGGGSGGVIATVGGTDITEADIGELFESQTLPIDETLREAIFAVVAREVLLQGLTEDFDAELDEEGVDALYDELVSQMETAGMTPAAFLDMPGAGLEMLRFNADIGVIRQQVIDGVVALPETIETFFSDPTEYTTVCARHILVETEDEALATLDRLEAGEGFGDVAGEVSLDSPTGDLGCSPAARYVDEFADATMTAELGEYVGPVETTFGFHVIVVDDRYAPTEQEFTDDPLAWLTEEELQTLWGRWLNDKLGEAEVDLDEKYGFWTDVGIVPPDRPDLVPDDGE